MELLDFLNKSVQEQFIATSALRAIEKQITEIIKQSIKDKYSDKKLLKDNLEFELFGVSVRYWNSSDKIEYRKIVLVTLDYICISKLPKDKQLKVDEAMKQYGQNNHFGYNNLKVQLWHSLRYDLDIESCLSGRINLDIS